MKLLTISILTIFFVSFASPGKKDNLLLITKKYFPDNYVLLEAYPDVLVNQLAKGDSLSVYVFGLTTIMHEAYHFYESNHNIMDSVVRQFRINDTLKIAIEKFKSFPCIELNNLVPVEERRKVFRYRTYIDNPDQNHDTQQNGFLGLLGEYVAYYQEFKTYNEMYKFLKDNYGYDETELWSRYLCEISSVKYSLNEFKLFISWYLQYAKTNHNAIYQKIIQDRNIHKLYRFIDNQNNSLTKELELNRNEIVKNLGQRIKIKNGFLTISIKMGDSYGLNDIESQQSVLLLSKPENKILNELN